MSLSMYQSRGPSHSGKGANSIRQRRSNGAKIKIARYNPWSRYLALNITLIDNLGHPKANYQSPRHVYIALAFVLSTESGTPGSLAYSWSLEDLPILAKRRHSSGSSSKGSDLGAIVVSLNSNRDIIGNAP
ncbi:hypothetical protein RJZ56_007380 [Blastomyces dermatitidis]